jgi:hypothetical protein
MHGLKKHNILCKKILTPYIMYLQVFFSLESIFFLKAIFYGGSGMKIQSERIPRSLPKRALKAIEVMLKYRL